MCNGGLNKVWVKIRGSEIRTDIKAWQWSVVCNYNSGANYEITF